jgi:hypothetical protein
MAGEQAAGPGLTKAQVMAGAAALRDIQVMVAMAQAVKPILPVLVAQVVAAL